MRNSEAVPCMYCGGREHELAAVENGYRLVRCNACGLLYVNPRPSRASIDQAVSAGLHPVDRGHLNQIGRFSGRKVSAFRQRLLDLLGTERLVGRELSWLDIGAGHGELVSAVRGLVANPERVVGLEPCIPKQQAATARGLDVRAVGLDQIDERFGVVSMVDVFSHLPDPRGFLHAVVGVLEPGGMVVVVTGNNADIPVEAMPRPLLLPDHLVFAGERHLESLLAEAGLRVERVIRHEAVIPESALVGHAKNAVKRLIGRPPRTIPRHGPFRELFVLAVLAKPDAASEPRSSSPDAT